MAAIKSRRSRTASLRLSLTFDDEGLALLGDFALALPSELSDGVDSGFSTPESFSPLPEMLLDDVSPFSDLAVPGQDLLKSILAAPTSLSDLPHIPLDLDFPLGDICEQMDVAGAADFIGLHIDHTTTFLGDLNLSAPVAWDADFLLHGASGLLLGPGSESLPTVAQTPSVTSASPAASVRPALIDNAHGSTSEDEDDEIDVVTVEEPERKKAPTVHAGTKASPQLKSAVAATARPLPPLDVEATPSASSAATVRAVPTSTAAAAPRSTPQGLASFASMSLPSLMQLPTATKTAQGAAAAAAAASARSATSANKYHPYAAAGSPAHTPKRNTERKRQLHNELERKRREDLNNVFNALGAVIPDLTGPGKNGQPTQTQILQGATDHLRFLKERHAELMRQKESTLTQQAALRARLMELTSAA